MTVFGIILFCLGEIACLYGNLLNNNVDRQLENFLESGSINSGSTDIYVGMVVAIVGVILIITGFVIDKYINTIKTRT